MTLSAADDHAIVDTVSRQAVADAHRARLVATNSSDAQHVVCVGHPLIGMEVRITRDGKALAPRQIGTIEIRGPAIADELSNRWRRRAPRGR